MDKPDFYYSPLKYNDHCALCFASTLTVIYNNKTIFIEDFDHLTSKRYFNLKFNPLALTMYPLTITNDNENYIIFCFLQLNETNKSILITTTTINQYEKNPSHTSTITNNIQNDQSIETTTTTINEQIKINNKYDYLIEFSNFKYISKQAFLYQLTKTKMILLINTTDCIHSYSIEYDQITLPLKILFYHCIYQSLINDIDIDSINPIILDDGLINNDQQSIISDKDENLEIKCDDNNMILMMNIKIKNNIQIRY
ncbi:unnamed protein product [Rotaria sp. Silwood2]|nr:unnamed protein product [Rotaria sp. Silwood2]CAF4381617.1 unnamed protein product [Rotaria sp. Silwood2]